MSAQYDKALLSVKYHLIFELFLILIITFFVIKLFFDKTDIRVDPQGFVQNTVLNYSFLQDGTFIVAKQNGEIIDTVKLENPPNQGTLQQLHGISLAVFEDIDKRNLPYEPVGVIDQIVSPAIADEHNLAGHKYRNVKSCIDGQCTCTRYDKTLNWKDVGACI